MSGPRRGRLLPHHDSSQVAAALFGEAAAPQRRTRPPAGPNHVAANKQSVRAKSDANRLARQQQDADVRPLRPRARRSSSEGGAPPRAARPAGGRDFVAENAAAAAMAGMRRRSAGGDTDKSGHPAHAPGEVPQYLLQRKLELAAQYVEEQEAKQRALIPAGMRLLPDEERVAMLARLKDLQEEADRELQALPFVAETVSQRRHMEQLEARLAELEEAVRVFSRPKVLVEA